MALMTHHRHNLDDADVIVLDEPSRGPFHVRRLSAPALAVMRPPLLSALLIAGILALHMMGFALLEHSMPVFATPAASPAALTVTILPRIRDGGGDDLPDLSALVVQLDEHFTDLHIDQPSFDFEVARNGAAASAAPSLIGRTLMDMSPYVREAALSAGEGVTVVLRIEVLEDGTPGRIEVDTSGGSRQIDQAAIHYARTRHWNAGRVQGIAQAVWIRWGVRLQA